MGVLVCTKTGWAASFWQARLVTLGRHVTLGRLVILSVLRLGTL